MDIQVVPGDITEIQADAIVIGVFEETKDLDATGDAVDRAMGGALRALLQKGEVTGKPGEVIVLHTLGKLPAAKLCVTGLGKKGELNADRIRRASAEASRVLRRSQVKTVASVVPGAGVSGVSHETAAQAMTEGALLGLYAFRKHQTREQDEKDIAELRLVECEEIHASAVGRGVKLGTVLAESTNMARDMVNEPSNFMTPTILAEEARRLAGQYGLECRVLEREEIASLGMGAFLGVSRGSDEPPKLIVMSYKGDAGSSSSMGWVGKGITFDSGGISLKPADGMGEMKGDMAGGAAVISAMVAVARLKPSINVTALIPATENLPSGHALKPGDVLRAMNGKTIEIITTDAEGRLVLADALTYAVKMGLTPLVDLATLTGACHIALGDVCSGVFSASQELLDRIVAAGRLAGECMWPMPMFDEYKDQIKSNVADIKNSGGRWGGAITAALFLAEFVGKIPWAHVDIAGTARMEKDRGYLVKDATGVGVRMLVHLALSLAGTGGRR